MDEKFGRWGRRNQTQFEHEVESWTTDECLRKTFFHLRLWSMSLGDRRLEQVERVLLSVQGAMENHTVQGELNALENGLTDQMTMVEGIGCLYERYRSKLVGQRYDKIKWAAEIYGSGEESMRIAQERPLEMIEDRTEIAFFRNDQEENDELDRLHRRIGIL